MTPAWAWPLLILGLLGWVLATIFAMAWVGQLMRNRGLNRAYRTIPSRDEKLPAPGGPVRMDSPAPGPSRAAGSTLDQWRRP
jgi:hypothetical protein